MANLFTVVDCLFTKKYQWPSLTIEDKENAFFMVNRNMSKKFPDKAQRFNIKDINRSMVMDLWFFEMKNQVTLPYWFWSGKKMLKKDENILNNNLYLQRIINKYELSNDDLDVLQELHQEWLQEEIEYLKHIDSANETTTNKRRK